ncbi:MAG: hypothetical protein AAF408_19700, partial [Pseudomonadota bacterium]
YLAGRRNFAGTTMTNQIAIWLGIFILGAVMLDYSFYGTEHLLFLSKKLLEFLDWLAFWR